jgi:hypothetical protein
MRREALKQEDLDGHVLRGYEYAQITHQKPCCRVIATGCLERLCEIREQHGIW